jgi:hypothetical protein
MKPVHYTTNVAFVSDGIVYWKTSCGYELAEDHKRMTHMLSVVTCLQCLKKLAYLKAKHQIDVDGV